MATGKLVVEVSTSNVTIDSAAGSETTVGLSFELSTNDSRYKMIVTGYEINTQNSQNVEFSVKSADLVGKEGSKDSPTTITSDLIIRTKTENSSTEKMKEFSTYASVKVSYDLYNILIDPPVKDPGTYDPIISGNTYKFTQKPAMAEIPEPEDPYAGMTPEEKEEAIKEDTSEEQRKKNKQELMEKAKSQAGALLMGILTPLIEPMVSQIVGATGIAKQIVSQIQKMRSKREANLKNFESVQKILSRLTGLPEDKIEMPKVTTDPDESTIVSTVTEGKAAPTIKYSVSKDDPINESSDYTGLLESGKLYDIKTKYTDLQIKKETWEKYLKDLETSENPDALVAPDKFTMVNKNSMDKAKSDLTTNLSRVISIDYRFVSLDKIKDLYNLISLTIPSNPVQGSAQNIAVGDEEDRIAEIIENAKYGLEEDEDENSAEEKITKKVVEEAMNSDVGMKVQKGCIDISDNAQALVTTSPLQLQHGVMSAVEPMAAVIVTPMGPGAVASNALQVLGSAQDLKVSIESAKAPLNNIYTTAAEIGLPADVVSSMEPVKQILDSITLPV
jgi:hypothetical protein